MPLISRLLAGENYSHQKQIYCLGGNSAKFVSRKIIFSTIKIGNFLNFLAESRCFIFLSSNVMADILQRAMYRHHASHFRETPSKINVNSIQIWLPPSPPCQINAFSCRISGTPLLFRGFSPNNDEIKRKAKDKKRKNTKNEKTKDKDKVTRTEYLEQHFFPCLV